MSEEFRNRLRTVDKEGYRLWVYADLYSGAWRWLRGWASIILIAIYLGVPWIKIGGYPFLKFDFVEQRFYLGGKVFWPHEVSVFVPAVIALIFFVVGLTAVWGRVFCGWACPQTVFLEFVYRPIERWIEGSWKRQKLLDQAPWSLAKLWTKSIKWGAFGVFSFIIANSFLAYFVGPESVLKVMTQSPAEHPFLFGVMLMVFAGFMFNFGWFREQMCTIVCPYGRLQSILMDSRSLIVGYKGFRGEPRGKHNGGDCVDCMRCVQVCPTGIDIRDGTQLECIHCLACADACDEIMDKVKKPRGLISYTDENELRRLPAGPLRIRPFFYFGIAAVLSLIVGWRVVTRTSFDVSFNRKSAVQFQIQGELITNQIQFVLENKTAEELVVEVSAGDEDTTLLIGVKQIHLPPRDKAEATAFVQLPQAAFRGGNVKRSLHFATIAGEFQDHSITLFGPQTGELQ